MAISAKMIVTAVAIVGILVLGGGNQASAELKECNNLEGLGVLIGCQMFIEKEGEKVAPSADCCQLVNEIGMPCTCKLVTKEIEDTISMEKLIFVAQSCGQPLQKGTNCGSKL